MADEVINTGLSTFLPHDVKVPQEPRPADQPLPRLEDTVGTHNFQTSDEARIQAQREEKQRRKEEQLVIDREAKKAAFLAKVAEARRPVEQKHVPMPVAPRITAQTLAEMEEGKRQNAIHAERTRAGPIAPRREVDSTPVHRPGDWVPGMNQGQNGARNVG